MNEHCRLALRLRTTSRRILLGLAFATSSLAHAQAKPPVPPLYGPAGVSAQAVKQGQLGSCYFHSSIAAIANRNPGILRGALQDGGDGTYTVRFVDGSSETVQLDDALFARNNKFDLSDGLWVTILLRAMAQSTMRDSLIASISATALPDSAKATATALVRGNDALLLAYDRAVRSTVYQDGTIDRDVVKTALNHQVQALNIPVWFSKPLIDFLDAQGFFETLAKRVQLNGELFGAYRAVGQGGLVISVLGKFDAPSRDVELHGSSEARTYLRKMQQDGLPMVATTGQSLDPAILQRLQTREGGPDWWVATHSYTILAYDPDADQVTLRNPWGDHPGPAGVFTISMSDFVAAYPNIDFPK